LTAVPEYSTELYANKKNKIDEAASLAVLKDVLPILEAQDDYSNDALYAVLLKYAEEKGFKNGYVMWPVRIALSGKVMTPAGATEILELLGKEESVKRIKEAINKLS
ncbi:MAG: glutamate--tRNA ligase, partial [Lachnospiraceae bacterium]|nr:glutamate--tRNA ligase [Lachnospiraceae bacterium]